MKCKRDPENICQTQITNTTIKLQISKTQPLNDNLYLKSNYFCSFKFTLNASQTYALDVYRRSGYKKDETIDFHITTFRNIDGMNLKKKDHYIKDQDLRNN